jgi:hypothetical protein
VKRTTWAPVGAADLVVATHNGDAFDDRRPTQPIAVGRYQVGLVLDDRHTHAPGARRVTLQQAATFITVTAMVASARPMVSSPTA